MNSKFAHKSYLRTSETIDMLVIAIASVIEWFDLVSWPIELNLVLRIILGMSLLFIGVSLIIMSKRELSRLGQKAGPGCEITNLVTTGIFTKSRNPIYLANLVLYFSVSFFFNAFSFALFVPIGIFLFYFWLILPEEKYLSEKFPAEFHDYKLRVGRWWSFSIR